MAPLLAFLVLSEVLLIRTIAGGALVLIAGLLAANDQKPGPCHVQVRRESKLHTKQHGDFWLNKLAEYKAKPGGLVPVWTIEVQTLPEDTDHVLDENTKVHPLSFGRYQRNASISAIGKETAQPEPGSTTTTHVEGFEAGATETYPMVELKISVEWDLDTLSTVMDAIIYAHHYEEPLIFVN